MWRASTQVDHDERFVRRTDTRFRLKTQQLREAQACQANSAQLQKTPPRESVAVSPFIRAAENRKHQASSFNAKSFRREGQ
jgi:hypothetical protein